MPKKRVRNVLHCWQCGGYFAIFRGMQGRVTKKAALQLAKDGAQKWSTPCCRACAKKG